MHYYANETVITPPVKLAVDYLIERQHILEMNSSNNITLKGIEHLKTGNFLIIGDKQDKIKEKHNVLNIELALDRFNKIIKNINLKHKTVCYISKKVNTQTVYEKNLYTLYFMPLQKMLEYYNILDNKK